LRSFVNKNCNCFFQQERVIKVIVVRNVSPCVDETQLADVKEMKVIMRHGFYDATATFYQETESENLLFLINLQRLDSVQRDFKELYKIVTVGWFFICS